MSYEDHVIAVLTHDTSRCALVRRGVGRLAVAARVEQITDVDELIQEATTVNGHGCCNLPHLIVLDGWPDAESVAALEKIRAVDSLAGARVVALSASNAAADLTLAYRMGANSCLAVPADDEEFTAHMAEASRYWLLLNRWPTW